MTTEVSNTPAPSEDQPTPTVPYSRFSQVLNRAKAAEAELATLKAAPAGSLLPNPPATETIVSNPAPANPGVAPTVPVDSTDWKTKHDAISTELNDLRLSRLRDRAALKAGLPLDMADRLVGDTDEAIQRDAELLASRVGTKPAAPNIDAGTPNAARNRAVFTMAQISDPAFYQAHEAEIMLAYKQGLIG